MTKPYKLSCLKEHQFVSSQFRRSQVQVPYDWIPWPWSPRANPHFLTGCISGHYQLLEVTMLYRPPPSSNQQPPIKAYSHFKFLWLPHLWPLEQHLKRSCGRSDPLTLSPFLKVHSPIKHNLIVEVKALHSQSWGLCRGCPPDGREP